MCTERFDYILYWTAGHLILVLLSSLFSFFCYLQIAKVKLLYNSLYLNKWPQHGIKLYFKVQIYWKLVWREVYMYPTHSCTAFHIKWGIWGKINSNIVKLKTCGKKSILSCITSYQIWTQHIYSFLIISTVTWMDQTLLSDCTVIVSVLLQSHLPCFNYYM